MLDLCGVHNMKNVSVAIISNTALVVVLLNYVNYLRNCNLVGMMILLVNNISQY